MNIPVDPLGSPEQQGWGKGYSYELDWFVRKFVCGEARRKEDRKDTLEHEHRHTLLLRHQHDHESALRYSPLAFPDEARVAGGAVFYQKNGRA